MSVHVTKDCLRLDRTWAAEEFERYQTLIEERRSWGYYQQIVIEDAAGKRLTTPGTHPCTGVLATLDRYGFPAELTGKSVLDIGCNAGFYSIVAKLRGAAAVLGLDAQPHYIEHASLVKTILDVDVEFRRFDGYDLDPAIATFDVVLNTGVVYHLQNPMDFLTRVARVTRESMYIESEVLLDPRYAEHAWFIEKEYCQDSSNWWIYGPRCLERMARAAGFRDVAFQGYVWMPPRGARTPEGLPRQGRGAFVCRK